jgi:hypothetical protein
MGDDTGSAGITPSYRQKAGTFAKRAVALHGCIPPQAGIQDPAEPARIHPVTMGSPLAGAREG